MSFVKLEDVALAYGNGGQKTVAVESLDLTIDKGEFVAIVGPSGCGKSSLLKLVSGLMPPTGGRVVVNGETIVKPVKIVGMAFQNATLLPWRTAIDNVLLPLEIVRPHRDTFRRDYDKNRAKAEKLLATVGLEGFGDRFPWQLSGGMQQRTQLCRALIHEPELLLLDEPFGALDAFTREELWNVLETLYLDRKCTVMLITHDLREAAYLANRVAIMSARPGKVIEDWKVPLGRPRDLEDLFKPEMVDLVHEMRNKIQHGRQVS